MRILPLLVIVLSVSIFWSCDSTEKKELEVIPLKVGNEWTYEFKVFRDGEIDSVSTITNRVTDSISIEGNTWFVMNEFDADFFLRNNEHGQLEYTPNSLSIDGKNSQQLFFPYPVSIDTSFEVNYSTSTMFSNHSLVEVGSPAGRFKCYEYLLKDIEDEQHYVHYFVHPGIGIVKYENKTADYFETAELTAWNLK